MSKPLIIVADAHIWGAREAFSQLPGYNVELRLLEHPAITRETVRDADILLTRSSNRVDASLLQGSRIRFAATATIGDDHYDIPWLEQQGIVWANAAGSSTGSVIEYMIAVLLELQAGGFIDIPQTSIGIIGAGRIGGRLAEICRNLGMQVLLNDPPRARREGDAGFVSLDAMFQQADVISLHTPLTLEGPDPTWHLLDAERLQSFRGKGIINAARGACLDNRALLDWLQEDAGRWSVLDCWEHEPDILQPLLAHRQCVIATPHIAGHSLDGKAANTLYVYRALCRFLGIEPVWNPDDALPQAQPLELPATGESWHDLHAAVQKLYPLMRDVHAMRGWSKLDETQRARAFRQYRRHYPERRAWHLVPVHFKTRDHRLPQLAKTIGIRSTP